MKPIIHTVLRGLAAVLVLTGTAAAKHPEHGIPRLSTTDGASVVLTATPGSEVDRLARQLMARELESARARGEDPLVLVGMGRLNDADELLFVQLQSPGECGSAGCSTVSFRYTGDRWLRHRSSPDLIVKSNRLIWYGAKYGGVG